MRDRPSIFGQMAKYGDRELEVVQVQGRQVGPDRHMECRSDAAPRPMNIGAWQMANELNDIVAKFRAWYPDCPPLGWHMRDRFINRWCRIDNLPGRADLAQLDVRERA